VTSIVVGGEEWTQEQHKALEEGLVKYPSSMETNARWDAISAGVPGKSKKDCLARYKAIKEEVQAKRAASTKA